MGVEEPDGLGECFDFLPAPQVQDRPALAALAARVAKWACLASDGVIDFARLASLGMRESGVDVLDLMEPVKEDFDLKLAAGEASRAAVGLAVLVVA